MGAPLPKEALPIRFEAVVRTTKADSMKPCLHELGGECGTVDQLQRLRRPGRREGSGKHHERRRSDMPR
jgi:hypothetical protein